eukprot:264319-Chlamydomonas_euryale.AAC.1
MEETALSGVNQVGEKKPPAAWCVCACSRDTECRGAALILYKLLDKNDKPASSQAACGLTGVLCGAAAKAELLSALSPAATLHCLAFSYALHAEK